MITDIFLFRIVDFLWNFFLFFYVLSYIFVLTVFLIAFAVISVNKFAIFFTSIFFSSCSTVHTFSSMGFISIPSNDVAVDYVNLLSLTFVFEYYILFSTHLFTTLIPMTLLLIGTQHHIIGLERSIPPFMRL